MKKKSFRMVIVYKRNPKSFLKSRENFSKIGKRKLTVGRLPFHIPNPNNFVALIIKRSALYPCYNGNYSFLFRIFCKYFSVFLDVDGVLSENVVSVMYKVVRFTREVRTEPMKKIKTKLL